MVEPFVSNHQYNFITQQAGMLEYNLKTVADLKVIEAVKANAAFKVVEQFPNVLDIQKQLLERISTLDKAEEFQKYLNDIKSYLVPFPRVNEKQMKQLFPKNKKLKTPDLEAIDYRFVTYLGWVDIASNKLLIVYHYCGEVVGVECRYTLTNKKGICALCNKHSEVALVTAVTKSRPANSPDYYKSVGNYMCIDSDTCNKKITDVAYLERFIQDVIG